MSHITGEIRPTTGACQRSTHGPSILRRSCRFGCECRTMPTARACKRASPYSCENRYVPLGTVRKAHEPVWSNFRKHVAPMCPMRERHTRGGLAFFSVSSVISVLKNLASSSHRLCGENLFLMVAGATNYPRCRGAPSTNRCLDRRPTGRPGHPQPGWARCCYLKASSQVPCVAAREYSVARFSKKLACSTALSMVSSQGSGCSSMR